MPAATEKQSEASVIESMPISIAPNDLDTLCSAYFVLEHPSLAARLTSVVGTPIEIIHRLLSNTRY